MIRKFLAVILYSCPVSITGVIGENIDNRECSADESPLTESFDCNSSSVNSSNQDFENLDQMARVIKEGSTIVINANAKHTASIILTHGLGDTAEGWADAAVEMSKQLPHVRWILPTAPSNPVSLNGGMRMPSWYNIESLSKSRGQQQCQGIEESTSTIHSLIQKERVSGIECSRIVLAGFSQGGAMSLWTGLQFPASYSARLAGVVVLSGYLPKEHAFVISSHGRDTPVLHCHGSADPLVLPAFAEESRKHVLAAGHVGGYELKMYPGLPHSANMQELSDVVSWLRNVLPNV